MPALPTPETGLGCWIPTGLSEKLKEEAGERAGRVYPGRMERCRMEDHLVSRFQLSGDEPFLVRTETETGNRKLDKPTAGKTEKINPPKKPEAA